MTTPRPPTQDIGNVDLLWTGTGAGTEVGWWETTIDTMFPQSAITYRRMRNDPQIAAVLGAYALPMLRANWLLDPEGCKPAVVQHVADDLGVGILGKDNKPGPARRRGIIWQRHLRQVLDHLVFGFMPFERRYEITGSGPGSAHLINLGQRPPWTIANIKVNPDGSVVEVTQTSQRDPIPAPRLCWYVHSLEGANWTGQSMLRPAFGAWLLKHETWRVHATSIRRFGMGVPTVEAPAGGSAAMVEQARDLASSARAGDQAGVGLPSGFKFSLEGVSGGTPDALAFVEYLDRAMAKMVLAQLIELGQTRTGSRALGETFLDLFLLALQGLADEIATTATTGHPEGNMPGIITDLVDVNWGEDEPAPRLTCSGVGQDYQVTADAVAALLGAGAITPDADLEAFLRKTWRLPVKPPSPAAPPGGAVAPAVGPDGKPQKPKGNPGGPPGVPGKPAGFARTGDVSLSASARPLTEAEIASGFRPDQHQASWQSVLDWLLSQYRRVTGQQRAELTDEVAAAAASGNAGRALAVPGLGAGPALITQAMKAAAREAQDAMLAEAASQGVTVNPDDVQVDQQKLAQAATARATLAAQSMAAAASARALASAGGPDPAGDVAVYLDGLSDTPLRDQLGAAVTAAQNEGRMAVLRAAPEAAGQATYVATEVLDKNTCAECRAVDGTVYHSLAEAEAAYPTGGYRLCEGFARCRGTVTGLWGEPGVAARAWDESLHPRDHGKFAHKPGVGALSPVYNEIPETRGVGRGKGTYSGPTGREQADLEKQRLQVPVQVAEPITAKEARDASRPVTEEEFQQLARQGVNQLGRLRAMRSPITELDKRWAKVKADSYTEARKSWGGVTVDAHTGLPLDSHADKYALSVKKAGMHTVSVPEDASEEQFNAAMDRALAEFRGVLEGAQSYLGVFHDDEEHRIDIDPVLVVDTPGEVEAIGAYTHAIGGAYHFRSGNGFWPPHVAEPKVAAAVDGEPVRWAGPGQWRTYADGVQPGLSEEQDAEIEQAARRAEPGSGP